MTKVVLDTGFLSKLAATGETTLLCDESGRVIGYFEPLEPPTGKGADGAESPFSDEEIERFRQRGRAARLKTSWRPWKGWHEGRKTSCVPVSTPFRLP